jgi:hypothetical protein
MNIKLFLGVVSAFILVACSGRISENDLVKLNGYWEITKVVFQDGTTKPYTVNTTVDYIGIDGFNGYIKKMKPGLNGRYQTSNKAAQFKLIQKDGLWEMHFEGDQKSTLSLLELDSLEYAVKDQGQVRYYYKRYEPININDE